MIQMYWNILASVGLTAVVIACIFTAVSMGISVWDDIKK